MVLLWRKAIEYPPTQNQNINYSTEFAFMWAYIVYMQQLEYIFLWIYMRDINPAICLIM